MKRKGKKRKEERKNEIERERERQEKTRKASRKKEGNGGENNQCAKSSHGELIHLSNNSKLLQKLQLMEPRTYRSTLL